jgi:shikimate kinase
MLSTIPHADRNLVITGYMGPNQVMVVRRVAEKLGMPLANFEQRLEAHAGMSIEDIRIHYGEARMKTLEAEIIQELMLHRGAVIWVSGTVLRHNDYLHRLLQSGLVLCLTAALGVVLQRVHLSLGSRFHNPTERAIALGQVRREWTIRGADGVQEFDTSMMNEAQIVDHIVQMWREQSLQTRG